MESLLPTQRHSHKQQDGELAIEFLYILYSIFVQIVLFIDKESSPNSFAGKRVSFAT